MGGVRAKEELYDWLKENITGVGGGGGVTTKYLEEGNSVCFMTEDRKPFDSER